MSLPNQLKTARMTDSTLGSQVDDQVGLLEAAICDILGITIDTNVTETVLGMDNSGRVTKALIRQLAAPPVGWRFRDTTNGKEFRLALNNQTILFDENTGSEGTPSWATRAAINLNTGLIQITAVDPSNDNDLSRKAYVDNSVTTHNGLASPHASATSLEKTANKGAASGYASLDSNTRVPDAQLGTGTPDSTKFLRGDRAWADPSWMAKSKYMRYEDQKTKGTPGGSMTGLSWILRDLNTEVADDGNIGSVSDNKITLPAGTYYVKATAPFWQTIVARLRIYNVSDSAELVRGPNHSGYSLYGVGITACVNGYFTLSGTKEIQLQYISTQSYPTSGLGEAANLTGIDEVYSVMELWKVA